LKTNFGRPTFVTQPQSNVFVVRGIIYYVFNMEEEDKQYLLQAIFDVINSIDRFSQSRDVNIDYQELMMKLDFLQRLLVNMNLDYSICANVGEAYNILFNMEQTEHQSRQ
jgi:hypothetical protein